MRPIAAVADAFLEATVAGSFTRVGYDVRRFLYRWEPLADIAARSRFAGQRVLLTGATSGIGAAAAAQLVDLGADLHVVGRDARRTAATVDRLNARGSAGRATGHIADLSDLCAVADLCRNWSSRHDRLDVLIHNAGALVHDYRSASGHEVTYTAQVLAPHLMTEMLLDRMPAGGRVIVVSSGGMYAERLVPERMEFAEADFDGVRAYARAKRAQVELVAEWARRGARSGVRFFAMHPGWADTPGVRSSLPGFRRLTRPVLRDADQGADTVVWLAVSPPPGDHETFWLDRRPRGTTRIPFTAATAEQQAQLWELVHQQLQAAVAGCPGSRAQKSSSPATT